MAGYVKIWTTSTDDRAFLSLTLNERGAWFQIIVDAKKQRDNGVLNYRNCAAMGQAWGCDGRTARKIAAKLHRVCGWLFEFSSDGGVEVTIRNYKWAQEISSKEMARHYRKVGAKLPPPRPDQTIPYQTRPMNAKKKPPKLDPGIPFDEIISHLNFVTGRSQEKGFKPDSIIAVRNITKSWKAGMRLEDFLHVNQVKAEEWLASDLEKHLNPETLYGNKMEKYRLQRFTNRSLPEAELKNVIAGIEFINDGGYKIDGLRQTGIRGSTSETGGGLLEAAK